MILEATRKPIEEPSPFDIERDEHSRPHETWGETPLEGVDTRPASATSLGVSGRPYASRGDRSGQLIAGRYRILRRLGEGGMGSVWLAVDAILTRPVALKEPKGSESPLSDGRPGGQAVREARAAAVVSHPGVVQVYDVVVDSGREWIVMEPLSGPTLADAIRHAGSLPPELVVAIGVRLAEALQAIHREGVIHGDLKPSNVQLIGTGRPVLTDFGLASGIADVSGEAPTDLVGSPAYMAPEVIRTGARTPASDLFSLGATLYEAAEGRRPFAGVTPIDTALAVLRDSPRPALHGTPLGQVIDGLLVKDPRHRLGTEDAYAWLREVESELTWPTRGAREPASMAAC